MHLAQLRQYVDSRRKAHYLEGSAAEYIVPNWNVWRRESQLYADVEAYEDGVLTWNAPTGHASLFPSFIPSVLRVVEALFALAFSASSRYSRNLCQVEFKDAENPVTQRL